MFSAKSSNRGAANIAPFSVLFDCSSRHLAHPRNHQLDVDRIVGINEGVEILLRMDSKNSEFFSKRFRLIGGGKVVDQN